MTAGARAAALAVAVWLAPRASWAHGFEPAALDLREAAPGIFDVVWKPSGTVSEALVVRAPAHCRRIAGMSGRAPAEGPEFFRLDCGPKGLDGELLAVDGLAGSRVDVLVRIAWRDGAVTTDVLRSGVEAMRVPRRGVPGDAPARAVLSTYGRLGVDHILSGADHLLFVLGLLLLVPAWRSLVATVTAFTVAHSLTLAAAVTGILRVPPAPMEVLIALSIVLVAAELARPPDAVPTLARRAPWAVSFGFGLLHGLGFAGALREFGLPPDRLPLALLAFNGGVEIGQLLFVTALLPVVWRWRPWASGRAWRRLLPAYAMGTIAAVWTWTRFAQLWQTPS